MLNFSSKPVMLALLTRDESSSLMKAGNGGSVVLLASELSVDSCKTCGSAVSIRPTMSLAELDNSSDNALRNSGS